MTEHKDLDEYTNLMVQPTPQLAKLPQSNALAEAQTDSLAELLARDPSSLGTQDLDRVIAVMREQREKWKVLEAQGKTRPRPTKGLQVNTADLGF